MFAPSLGWEIEPYIATNIHVGLFIYLFIFCLACSWTLKMEAICSSETSVGTQLTTRRFIPEDLSLHNHRCENLKSYRRIVPPELSAREPFRM
jgi:hypothetical protein